MSAATDSDGVEDQPMVLTSDPMEYSSPTLPPAPAMMFASLMALTQDLSETESGSDYILQPTSGRHSSDLPDDYQRMLLPSRQEIVRDALQLDRQRARALLQGLPVLRQEGWCMLVSLVPTKGSGYVQLSLDGANKFAMLQQVVLWAQEERLEEGQQASHRCHQPLCKVEGHITPESISANNARKGCLVWIDSPHCPSGKKILLCQHDPCCIKYVPGWNSMEKFIEGGVCSRVRGSTLDNDHNCSG